MTLDYDISENGDADIGDKRIEWAEMQMPVLRLIRERFGKEKPLKGKNIGCCLHVTTETANLMRTLKAGGANVFLCASNPLSTQDHTAAALVHNHGIPVFAVYGEDNDTYYSHIYSVLDQNPDITMDDGGDLVSTIHKDRPEILEHIKAGTEETTTGVIRFRAMERDSALRYPIIAVNDAMTKHLFDNRYGTGQSSMDGILRATNHLIAGKNFVVSGYGWCGRGSAMRAKGLGANVIITEVDPLRALEALMDGYRVMPMTEAVKVGDIFLTATGDKNVIGKEHMKHMKDGTILANTGHFDVEISKPDLESITKSKREIRDNVAEYQLETGKRIYLLGEGRLVNLAAAEGHPASVMDMSFANQALTAEYIVKHGDELSPKVYPVPPEIDTRVAELKLDAMGVTIDRLTEEQQSYLSSWKEGT